jgi:hypothetical protein
MGEARGRVECSGQSKGTGFVEFGKNLWFRP